MPPPPTTRGPANGISPSHHGDEEWNRSELNIYIIIVCAVSGTSVYIFNSDSGLGKEFQERLDSIGPIFVPVAGLMAAIPHISQVASAAIGPLFITIGLDPSIAANNYCG